MLKNNFQNSEESFREAEASACKLKLHPDSIARQPHASFAKNFAPDHQ
jgi:hypothetical protein